jgi:diacylglycerol kinase (ATP)
MTSIALLVNRDSGDGSAERVEGLLAAAGAEVTSFDVRDCDDAAASGAERLVVAGGDGSLGFAAAAAGEAGIPIAVVPTGTANDFAAHVGLPAELEDACRLAATGTESRTFELGCVGERPFVNVASVGLAPAAAEHADGLKGRLGALAYPVGAIRAGLLAQPVECRVTCDGRALHDGEAWQVSVASVGAFGGGASVEADATDGRLDVIVIEGSNRLRLAKHAYGLRIGSIEGQSGVLDCRCSAVELELGEGECLNVDGELIEASELGDSGTIRFQVKAGAFDLIVG